MNKITKILGIIAVTVAMMVNSTAQATSSIGINFAGGNGANTTDPGTPTAFPVALLAPGDVTGVVPQPFWNNEISPAVGPGGPAALVDNTSAPTGATVS